MKVALFFEFTEVGIQLPFRGYVMGFWNCGNCMGPWHIAVDKYFAIRFSPKFPLLLLSGSPSISSRLKSTHTFRCWQICLDNTPSSLFAWAFFEWFPNDSFDNSWNISYRGPVEVLQGKLLWMLLLWVDEVRLSRERVSSFWTGSVCFYLQAMVIEEHQNLH